MRPDDLNIDNDWAEYYLGGGADLFVREAPGGTEIVVATDEYFGGQQYYRTHHIDPDGHHQMFDHGLGKPAYDEQAKALNEILSP